MIVEDDPVVLDALDRLLALWGYNTLPFSRFEDARLSLAVQSPDALVVDIRLGEFNGLQLVHLAKQSNPGLAVAVVSGFDDSVLRNEATLAGAAYLLKPAELQQLKEFLPPAAGG
jgi:DNA-binding response OmpR family regulator